MAKIRKIEWKDVNTGRKFTTHVEFKEETLNRFHGNGNYSNKFFIKVPIEFEKIAETKEWEDKAVSHRTAGRNFMVLFAESSASVIKIWEDFMVKASNNGIKEQKVILYRVTHQLPEKDNRFHDNRTAMEMTIDYIVCTKKSWGEKQDQCQYLTPSEYDEDKLEEVFNSYSSPDIGKNLKGNDWAELRWTEENEQFFANTHKAFREMIERVQKALGSQKSVLSIIANQQKLLS